MVIFVLSRFRRPKATSRILDPVHEVAISLNCSREQASELLGRYQGNATLAIMEVKRGNAPLVVSHLTQPEGWAVLLTEPEDKNPVALAKLLAQVSGLTVSQAVSAIHADSGALVVAGLQPADAKAYAKALCQAGTEAVAVDGKALTLPSFGGDLREIRASQDGVGLITTDGQTLFVQPDQLLLVTVGILEGETRARSDYLAVAKGRPFGNLYLAGEEGPVRYAFVGRGLVYQSLGNEMAKNTAQNLKLTLRKLLESCPQTATNRSVEQFFSHDRIKLYSSPQELEAESLGILTRCHQS